MTTFLNDIDVAEADHRAKLVRIAVIWGHHPEVITEEAWNGDDITCIATEDYDDTEVEVAVLREFSRMQGDKDAGHMITTGLKSGIAVTVKHPCGGVEIMSVTFDIAATCECVKELA